jgi:DNA-binding transcriptional regulator YiaG
MTTQSIALNEPSIWSLPFDVGTGARSSAFEVPKIEVTSINSSSSWKDWLTFNDITWICDNITEKIYDAKSNQNLSFTSWIKNALVLKRIEIKSEPKTESSVATTKDQIAIILSALSLRVTELANVLDVQRPTIYAWLQGDFSPQNDKKARLNAIFKLANKWRLMSNSPLGKAVRDAQIEGSTILDLLKQKKIDSTKIIKNFYALISASKLNVVPTKRRGLVASALQRQGIDRSKVKLNNTEITALSGKRFEQD